MTTKPLTEQRYTFYTTQLNPMTDTQIAKQHGLSLDELEDWKEKNSIQETILVEVEKNSRTVEILDKNKPPLTLELYKGYKELPKPISDNAIGNEHGMSVADMQKFKREHDLIGKYGKNTKDAVEKRVEPVEKVDEQEQSEGLPDYAEEREAHKNDAHETDEELEKEFSSSIIKYINESPYYDKPVAFKIGDGSIIEPEHILPLSEVVAPKIEQLSKIDATHLVVGGEQNKQLNEKELWDLIERAHLGPIEIATSPPELITLSENPDFTTFRTDYTPSDAQAAEMKKLRQELETLRREQEWLENRHVQDTAIVESVNEKIMQQEADRKQWDIMRSVFANLKDLRREHIKQHGYAHITHQERMTRLLSTLGVVAGQGGKEDYEQYVNLLVLASEVLAHAEQLRSNGNIEKF